MKKVVWVAALAAFSLAWYAQGQVSQSELGDPGTPPPRQVQPKPETPQPPVAPPPQQPAPQAAPSTPEPAPAHVVHDRNRVQSDKPVAAFWTVLPGR